MIDLGFRWDEPNDGKDKSDFVFMGREAGGMDGSIGFCSRMGISPFSDLQDPNCCLAVRKESRFTASLLVENTVGSSEFVSLSTHIGTSSRLVLSWSISFSILLIYVWLCNAIVDCCCCTFYGVHDLS
jgi:hypothetical protein